MSLTTTVFPYAEPISVHEMKAYMWQDPDITAQDAVIAASLSAGRGLVETMTGANRTQSTTVLATTYQLKLDGFPYCGYIEVPRVPLVEVGSITYVDSAGVTQTWASSNYTIDTARGRIYLAYNASWPSTQYVVNSVTVTFTAGLMTTFTADPTSDEIDVTGLTFTTGERVRILNSGGRLPTGLESRTDYFLIAGPKLSLTDGGLAVDVTAAGFGTHFIGTRVDEFEAARQAIKFLVAYWFRNREAVVLVPGAVPESLLFTLEALVARIAA